MENRKSSFKNWLFIGVLFVIAILVFVIVSISKEVRQLSPIQPALTVQAITPSTLSASVSVISTTCADAEKIDFSLVDLSISDGTPPYTLTITNSDFEPSGPYTILHNDEPIRIKVYGGDHFTASVVSSVNEIWSGNISLPLEAEFCKITPTPIPTSTITETVTDTPEPTSTVPFTPTEPSFTMTEIDTRGPIPTNISISVSPQVTLTTEPQSFHTASPQPSNTPQPTNTPQPSDTPQPTDPPSPTPTPINPNPRECEDGIDNDHDGKTDYPDDPDCKKPSHPKEK